VPASFWLYLEKPPVSGQRTLLLDYITSSNNKRGGMRKTATTVVNVTVSQNEYQNIVQILSAMKYSYKHVACMNKRVLA